MSAYQIVKADGGPALYRQISKILEQEIRRFHGPGDLLPPESELAERFNVNRHTLRRAIEVLIAEGLVERVHGKGTFVLEPTINYAIGSATRFTETLETQGHTTASRVLRKQVVPAIGGVAKQLQLREGSLVIFIETLREVDGRPFCLISHFLSESRFSELKEVYDGGSLHELIKRRYGVRLRRTESLISAVMPEGEDALQLNMPRTAPVLRVKSLNLDAATGEPIEYAVTRFRGDAAQLSVKP